MPSARRAGAPGAGSASDVLPRILLIALLGVVIVTQGLLVSALRQLPSEIFGGDLNYQMGCVCSIRDSWNPMASCSTSDALPGYLPLYGTLVALACRLTGLDAFHGMLAMAVVLKALSIWLLYRLIARSFGASAGVVTAALAYATHPRLLARYSEFAGEIVTPLFLIALIVFIEGPTMWRAVRLGLVLAAAGYTHAVAFIGSC